MGNYSYFLQVKNQIWVVDPFGAQHLLDICHSLQATFAGIVLTHGHHDHTEGVNGLLAGQNDLKVYSWNNLFEGQILLEHQEDQLIIYHTPGHTMDHITLRLVRKSQPDAFIVGDTIFHGGVGNCRCGDAEVLFESIQKLKGMASDESEIHCAHDYQLTNLGFIKSIQGPSPRLKELIQKKEQYKDQYLITTFGLEKTYNPFLITNNKMEFLELRQKRDCW